ncbi:MAG: hypothetical protein ACAH80_09765 [Alphaproteobacteria bacterium]
MADWFDKTNSQDAFAANVSTRTVLHGQAEKGNPLSEKSFIIAVSGLRHDDAADFLAAKADDKTWDDISAAFDTLYKNHANAGNHMWLINFIKKADDGENDTNSQIPQVHIHVLSGALTAGNEFIADTRSFHPHPKKDFYAQLAENKADVLARDMGQGLRALPLPPALGEAAQHYVITHEGYPSFAAFITDATAEEKRGFWKAVAQLALPLVNDSHGARVGYYNFNGEADAKLGHMAVEVAGGENLGQNGLKNRWFQKPKTP